MCHAKPDVLVLDIPVVFLTARSDAQTSRAGIASGGCAFLTKPYRLEELQAVVADAEDEKGC